MKAQWPFWFKYCPEIIFPFCLLNSCNSIQLHQDILCYDSFCYLQPYIDPNLHMDRAKEILCKGVCDAWCLLSDCNSIDTSLYTSQCTAICIAICISADGCIL